MPVTEIHAKSIIRKRKKIDSWFISHYSMNLYRGCLHNCSYCDGRSERYYVDGEFGHDISVKVNAIDILDRELNPKRKRVPLKQSFVLLGGGVGDSYQPIDEKYQLSRKSLKIIQKYNFPVHIITKSTLIERDIDLIKQINKERGAIVSISFSSIDNYFSKIFEPAVPSPDDRLKMLSNLKNQGIITGMFLMPVIPFITDTPELIDKAVQKAHELNFDYIIFSPMTLKKGKQFDHFINVLKKYFSDHLIEYNNIYSDNKWGNVNPEYYRSVSKLFNEIANHYKIPVRIPAKFFKNILSENDYIITILEQLNYLENLSEKRSYFGRAANSIAQMNRPLSSVPISKIKGIGPLIERTIKEILENKTSFYYERLLKYR